MDARIIGPASELGQFETLAVFGCELSRDWSKIDPSPAVLRKLQGNRYVELRERRKPTEEPPIDTLPEIKARLTELGVEFDARGKKADLEALLELAEAARASGNEGDAEDEA